MISFIIEGSFASEYTASLPLKSSLFRIVSGAMIDVPLIANLTETGRGGSMKVLSLAPGREPRQFADI
jgi:hypothetical protein